jgi:hypothetical protein
MRSLLRAATVIAALAALASDPALAQDRAVGHELAGSSAVSPQRARESEESTAATSGQPAMASASTRGGSLQLVRTTIDSGGASLLGGGMRLESTIGQPEIGLVTAGGLRLAAGFHRPALSAGPVEDRIFSDRFSSDP